MRMKTVKVYTLEEALELRKKYKAIDTLWKFIQHENEKLRETERYKKAVALAPQYGIDVSLYDNCHENWSTILKYIGKISLGLKEEGVDANIIEKLRPLNDLACWPLGFRSVIDDILSMQYWNFTDPPKDNELLPIELHGEKDRYAYPAEEDWLGTKIFGNPRGPIRAVVYTEKRYHEYNFQDIPATKKLLETIKETAAQWREAAKATGFDFDQEAPDFRKIEEKAAEQRWEKFRYFLEVREQTAWDAAPEELRNEHIKAVRQLVKEVWKYHQKKLNPPQISTKTVFPRELVFPTDKVSKKAFSGELNGGALMRIAQEREGSKKEITTLISIDFDDLGKSVTLSGRRELEPFDREVHDAIVSLVVGGNEYITPQMIYRTLVGDKEAKLSENHRTAIRDSITKCMFTQVDLDASADAEAYGYDAYKYRGPLLAAEMVTAKLNGQVMDAVKVLRPPVLYEYANKKNQIGRIDVKLLATPLNKTSDVLTLQGYLHRRILTMKNPKSRISRKILYGTIFDQIGNLKDREQKDKRTKMRAAVRKILDYWKSEKFIEGYDEEKRGSEFYGINIKID